jgi:hypothetical protein
MHDALQTNMCNHRMHAPIQTKHSCHCLRNTLSKPRNIVQTLRVWRQRISC